MINKLTCLETYASQPGGPLKGPADDGKRFSSDGRFILEVGEAKGGGLEEGGVGIERDRRLADDGKRFCDERCITIG